MSTQTIELGQMQKQIVGARYVSVPLVGLRTADPKAAIDQIEAVATKTPKPDKAPVVQWDIVRGFEKVNNEGAAVAEKLGGNKVLSPVQALQNAATITPEHTVLVMINLGDYWHVDPKVRQAIWNLRDPFKQTMRMMIGTMSEGTVPASLEHDMLTIDEPLPNTGALSHIVRAQFKAAKLPDPTDDTVKQAVDSIAGLSGFAAEQAIVLSMRRGKGIDLNLLRDRHRQMIENTKGLSVWRGSEMLDQVGGMAAGKAFLRRFHEAGMYRFGSVFWIDELEKALAGVKGDLTGITQDYLSVLLSYMQDNDVPGILLMGHPGTGKSYLAKAFAAMAGVPTIRADLGAMHGSLVGQSQHALRHAIKVQHAVSQGRPLFVATCNNVAVLPPELTNRFTWRFFVDLPDDEEKRAIWPIQLKRRGLPLDQKLPEDNDWNGREIDQCCRTAQQMKMTVREAAQYIVPIAQSSAEAIEERRREAVGRYLSVSYPGAYNGQAKKVIVGGRRVHLGSDPKEWGDDVVGSPN